MFIDTHTHLYAEEFDADRSETITNAINQSVTRFYIPSIDSEHTDKMFLLEKQFPNQCFLMMGLHPCSVKENYHQELDIVKKWLETRKFSAIGEIGLDFYWDRTFAKEQDFAFRQQIDWALHYQYPINIHCRTAFDEIFAILKSYKKLPKGIFHCFSGDYNQAKKIVSLGDFKLGIGGVVTFKNAGLAKVVEQMDMEHFVLETDAPYLAPTPYRGKRNESSYVPLIAQKIAEIKQISVEEVGNITTKNALAIFES